MAVPSSEILIALKNIDFSYSDGRRVFSDLNFTFLDNQHVGLAGPNGCGKTTLLSIIMGLLHPQRGEVEIFGHVRREEKDFKEVRPQIGFVFQDANDQLFCPTVADDIAFGPLNLGFSRKEADQIVAKTLTLLHLEGFERRVTYDLSGGEKKLVSIGTALALNPRLLILDEPTNSLDEGTVARLEQILSDCGLPYIVVSHDRGFLERTTSLVWTMTEDRLVQE